MCQTHGAHRAKLNTIYWGCCMCAIYPRCCCCMAWEIPRFFKNISLNLHRLFNLSYTFLQKKGSRTLAIKLTSREIKQTDLWSVNPASIYLGSSMRLILIWSAYSPCLSHKNSSPLRGWLGLFLESMYAMGISSGMRIHKVMVASWCHRGAWL